MNPEDSEGPKALIFESEREFLIACVSDQRPRFKTEGYWGIAASELRFRRALSERMFPTVEKVSKSQVLEMIAKQWASQTQGEDE